MGVAVAVGGGAGVGVSVSVSMSVREVYSTYQEPITLWAPVHIYV